MYSVSPVASNVHVDWRPQAEASSISQDLGFLVTTATCSVFRNAHSATVREVI